MKFKPGDELEPATPQPKPEPKFGIRDVVHHKFHGVGTIVSLLTDSNQVVVDRISNRGRFFWDKRDITLLEPAVPVTLIEPAVPVTLIEPATPQPKPKPQVDPAIFDGITFSSSAHKLVANKKRKTRSTDDLYMSDSENAQKLRSEIEPKLNMPAESLPLRLYQCPTEPQQIPTTHTFSAELIDGRVVEMPAPGDDWTESKREEFKRGDLRVRNLDYVKYNSPEPGEENYQIPTFDKYDDWDFFNITSEGACWAREMLRPNEPILSITTWIREISIEPPEEDPHPFREPSESNFIGLQIWPGHQDQKKHDIWNAFPHKHREPSSFNTWCLKSWPERDDEVE